jgi:hypothetical protein
MKDFIALHAALYAPIPAAPAILAGKNVGASSFSLR